MLDKLKSFFSANTDMPETIEDTQVLMEEIIAALKKVYDPEIPVNIYELGLIYDVIIEENLNVKIKMTLTAPGCPVAATFPKTVEDTVKEHVKKVQEVEVELVWDPPWTMERMSDAAKLQLGLF